MDSIGQRVPNGTDPQLKQKLKARTMGRRQGKTFMRNQMGLDLGMSQLKLPSQRNLPTIATLPSKRNAKKFMLNNETHLDKNSNSNQRADQTATSLEAHSSNSGGSKFSRLLLTELVKELCNQNTEQRESAYRKLNDICGPLSSTDPSMYSTNLVMALSDALIIEQQVQHTEHHDSLQNIALSMLLDKSDILFEYCSSNAHQFLSQRLIGILEHSRNSSIESELDNGVAMSSKLLTKQLTTFSPRLDVSWKQLFWMTQRILFYPNSDIAFSEAMNALKCALLKNMSEFLNQLIECSLVGDSELSVYFSNDLALPLFELLLNCIEMAQDAHVSVLDALYRACQQLLPLVCNSVTTPSNRYLGSLMKSLGRELERFPQILHNSSSKLTPRESIDKTSSIVPNEENTNTPSKKEQEKKHRTRNQVVQEIVSTEEAYIRSLSALVDKFLVPLRTKKILSSQILSKIFSNIEMLVDFHKLFLDHLKKSKDSIPSIILQYADFLKMYTPYINEYGVSIETICKLKSNTVFHSFLQQASPGSGEAELMSLLIKPVQRIPRYLLLLKELEKYTDPSHSESQVLTEAIEKVAAIASHVNLSKQRVEDFTKLIAIQNRIDARFSAVSTGLGMLTGKQSSKRISLIKPHRFLVREGNIVKRSKKGFKRSHVRHFYLFNDSVLWTTASESRPKVQGFIELSGATVQTHIQRRSNGRGSHFILEVNTKSRVLTMLFSGREQRDDWSTQMEESIQRIADSSSSFRPVVVGAHLGIDGVDGRNGVSVSPSRSLCSYSSYSQSTAYTADSEFTELSLPSASNSSPFMRSQSASFADAITTCLCSAIELYEEFIPHEILTRVLDICTLLLQEPSPLVLASVLEFFIYYKQNRVVLDREEDMAMTRTCAIVTSLLSILPSALSTYRDKSLDITYAKRADHDLDGFPVASNSWADRLLVCLGLFTESMRTSELVEQTLVDFVESNIMAREWKRKGSALIVVGLFQMPTSTSVRECIGILSRSKHEERRLVETTIWSVQRISSWPLEEAVVSEFLKGFVAVSNRLVLSMESDVKMLRNIALSLKKMMTEKSILSYLQTTHLNLVEMLFLNIILPLSELNHNPTRKLVFQTIDIVISECPSLSSKPVLSNSVIPKLVEFLPESLQCLETLLSKTSWTNLSSFSDSVISSALSYRIPSLLDSTIKIIPRGIEFRNLCDLHDLIQWSCLQISSSTISDHLLNLAARIAQEYTASPPLALVTALLDRIAQSSVSRKARDVPLLIKLCNTFAVLIIELPPNPVFSRIITTLSQCLVLDAKSHHIPVHLRNSLHSSILYCFGALKETGNKITPFRSTLIGALEITLRSPSTSVFALSLLVLGDLIGHPSQSHLPFQLNYPPGTESTVSSSVEDILHILAILPQSLKSDSEEVRENTLYVLREFAGNCSEKSVLVHLFGECKRGVIDALKGSSTRVAQKCWQFISCTVSCLGYEFKQFIDIDCDELLSVFVSQFPIAFDAEIHETVQDCFLDNVQLSKSFEKLFLLDSNRMPGLVSQRLGRLVELAQQLEESPTVSIKLMNLNQSLNAIVSQFQR